jgi:hypothetical protein
MFSRRHFLFATGAAGLGYMRFGEPAWFEVSRPSLALPKAAGRAPLTLLHLSDLHASPVVSLDFIEGAVQLALKSCKPDMVCLTGDFITTKWADWAGYSAVLSSLSKAAPAFAVLGNHDGGAWAATAAGYEDAAFVRKMLADAGIRLLYNEHIAFSHAGIRWNLLGLGDWWSAEMLAREAWDGLDPAHPTLVLSHNPDTKDLLGDFPWDLMLCGHTHGGQLDLPVIGTPFAPIRDRRYVAGLKPWNDRWLHITRGVGNLHGMRLNCRPEISILSVG